MKVRQIIEYINTFANEKWQYHWDNTGLQVGELNSEVTGILLCVDVLSDVIDEAIARGCNLIISHHPLLFSGVKRISDDYKSEIVKKLIKNDISVYSSHTAFDVCDYSMNHYIASSLGLENVRYLDNLSEMKCAFTAIIPQSAKQQAEEILNGLSVGNISFTDQVSGNISINGTVFKSLYGKLSQKLCKISSDIQIYATDTIFTDTSTGLGLIGELPQKYSAEEIILKLKDIFECKTIRVSRNYKGKKVKTVAMCSGSGSDYLKPAMRSGADLYICADLKWNDFLVCEESGITAACPTHFESEKSFIRIMGSKLKELDVNLNILESESEDIESLL